MIDTLQATPQAMKLMDDLITGQLEAVAFGAEGALPADPPRRYGGLGPRSHVNVGCRQDGPGR